jgi:hypothetical protein
VIVDRDPLVGARVEERRLIPAPLVEAEDPLRAEQGIGGIYRDGADTDFLQVATSFVFVAGAFNEADKSLLRRWIDGLPGTSVVEKLDRAARGWVDAPFTQAGVPLRRCDVLSGITGQSRIAGCGAVAERGLLAPLPEERPAAADEDLSPFVTHCGAFHTAGNARPPFLAAPPPGRTPRDVFRSWAHCIPPMLDWEAANGRTMPPAGRRRDALSADEPLRRRMLAFAHVAAEEQRALAHGGRSLPTEPCR